MGTATAVQVAGVPVAYFAMSWRSPRPEPHASWLDAVDRFADQVALAKTVIRRRAAQRETSDLAQRFQAGMLPRLPSDGPITVHSLYRPGLNQMLLGGDFLDVMSRDDDELAFIVGDVAGHGPEQAALGATLRGAWLALASVPALEIDDWAAALNRVVLQRASGEGLFVTGVMGTVSRSRGTLRYASAGHPPPILLSPDVRTTEAGGPALGLMPGAVYRVHEVALPAQWAVLLVTDGLFEGRLPNSDRLRGNYDDFLERLAERDLVPESAASWLPQFADELERLNGGQLSDDAAAILLLPTPGTGCGAPGVDS